MKILSYIILNALLVLAMMGVLFSSCSVCKPNKNLQVETSKIIEISNAQTNIYTDIVIDAPAKKVWETLTDFNNMHKWSSTIKGLSGDIKNGGSVIVKVDVGNGQVLDFPRSPFHYSEGEYFGWSGAIRLKGLTDNHKYRVEPISKCQSRFIQTEEFAGENPDITPLALAKRSIERYKVFNSELKKEVEKKIISNNK
jgi:hypothetical protein